MAFDGNYERYPYIFSRPTLIKVKKDLYKYYLVEFENLEEIYKFLNSNPLLNTGIYEILKSEQRDLGHSGATYEAALKDIISEEDPICFDFIDLMDGISGAKNVNTNKYKEVLSCSGGRVDNVLFCQGAPRIYKRMVRDKKRKLITVHTALSYGGNTSKYMVVNRAVILISIINAIEKSGYDVELNAFEMSSVEKEVVNIKVGVKKSGEPVDFKALYKMSCKVEFLRRILFRILETVAVEAGWGRTYGTSCKKDFASEVLDCGPNDIYFGTPQELDIGGSDIIKDFETVIEKINLADKFDIDLIKEDIERNFDSKAKELIKKIQRS